MMNLNLFYFNSNCQIVLMKEELDCKVNQQNFLLIKEKLKSAKAQLPSFLKKLEEEPQFMKEILDICFRPTSYQKQKDIVLTPDIPALIIDIFGSLYEDFIELLACDKIQKQTKELLGLQMQAQMQEMNAQDKAPKEDFIFLNHIHLGMLQGEPEDAALSYLNKIIARVYSHRPAQIMRFYQKKQEIIENIISKMNNKTIVEIFCKILEIESGKQFFKQYKIKYIRRYYEELKLKIESDKFQSWIQGILQLHKFITEKMQQKIDIPKYLPIIYQMNRLDFQILKIVNSRIHMISDNQFLYCLKWVEQLLKNDGYIMGQPNIRLSITLINRKNSISNNFYEDQSIKHNKVLHLSEQQLKEICKIIKYSIFKYIQSDNKQDNHKRRGQSIIQIYRILYFMIKIWTNLKNQTKVSNIELINDIINDSFLTKTFKIALDHPFNNSLHNYIKELIIQALQVKIINPEYFYNAEETYKHMILTNFPKKKNNIHQNTFYNKVYHIYKELISLYPLNSSINQIYELIKSQQERNNHLIGGDPRKLQADTLRGSNNAWSESSQSYEQFLEFDLLSNKSLSISSNKSPMPKRTSLATFTQFIDKYQGQYNIKQQDD